MSETEYPTLIEMPDDIRGERVLLRPYRVEDAEQILAAVDESREHLRPWVNWVDEMATIDDCRDYCIRCAARWLLRSDLSVGIFAADSGEYLGGTGLHDPDWNVRSFEVGYWMRVGAAGDGYVSQAVRLLVDVAFDRLQAQRIALTCDPENTASRRVAEHAGFVLEGTLRNSTLARDGRPADWLVYSLVPGDRERLPAGAGAAADVEVAG